MKILIIEDELVLLSTLKTFLEKEKYLVETATDYFSAIGKIADYEYDCILLDIMLPNGNGIDLLKEIKKLNKKDSVIIISAKDSVEDKVLGLDLGAVDYLAKPFHLLELHARIKSAMRQKNQQGEDFIQFKNIKLFPEQREATIQNISVNFNRKEYDLLYYFVTRAEKTIPKTTLIESVWGDHFDQIDSLDFVYSQIKNLRKKLKENQADADIQSVYGIGYKLIGL